MLNNDPWELVELKLRAHPLMLSLATEDYFFKDQFGIVRRFISLYHLHPKAGPTENMEVAEGVETEFQSPGYLEKEEICKWFYQGMPVIENENGNDDKGDKSGEGLGSVVLENKVISEDFFGAWCTKDGFLNPTKSKKKSRHKNKKKDEKEEPEREKSFVSLLELGYDLSKNVKIVRNVEEFTEIIPEIKKWPYLSLDFEFVPTTIVGQVH